MKGRYVAKDDRARDAIHIERTDQGERRLAGTGRRGIRRLQPDRVQALRQLPVSP